MTETPSHDQAIERAGDDAETDAASALDRRREELAVAALEAQITLTEKQIGLARNEWFRNRIKALRDGAVAVIVVLAAGLGLFVVWDSTRADGVVVEPFQTLPVFAEQGLTGEAVANRLLTEVTAIQAATPSNRARRTALSSSDQISVEIPATGLSLGEATRLLRRRLGDEQVVTGRLDQDADGAPVMTLYIDGEPLPVGSPEPKDGESPVQAVIRGAGEALFRHAEPYRYAIWLSAEGRADEAQALLRQMTLWGSAEDRAWAYNGLASLSQSRASLLKQFVNARAALELSPDLPNALRGSAFVYRAVGMTGWATRISRDAIAAGRSGQDYKSREHYDRYQVATAEEDHRAALGWAESMTRTNGPTDDLEETLYLRADALARLHDVRGARATEAMAASASAPGERGYKLSAIVQRPALEDWATLEAELKDMSGHEPARTGAGWAEDQFLFRPWLAIALARQGKADEAEIVMAQSPDFGCVLCLQARGEIAAARRDRNGMERWFGQTAEAALGLPGPLLRWGEGRLALGDAEGALVLARRARAAAPDWADAVRLEAEALSRLERREALARFARAADLAPQWGALRLGWARALNRFGDRRAAGIEVRAALARDLSPADRAAANRLLADLETIQRPV